MSIASVLVFPFYAYLLTGLVFAVWFVTKGVHRLDENMRHSPNELRLLLHYLIAGEQDRPVSSEILRYVGELVQLCGDIYRAGDWLALYKDAKKQSC